LTVRFSHVRKVASRDLLSYLRHSFEPTEPDEIAENIEVLQLSLSPPAEDTVFGHLLNKWSTFRS